MSGKQWRRADILSNLRSRVARGEPILAAGAGVGLIGKSLDVAGIDLIMAYNTGPFRMDGHGSLAGYLAYGDANELTCNLMRRLGQVVADTPIVAGIGAADPNRDVPTMIETLMQLGASGITNVPTAGLYGGTFREQIDGTGLGYPREVQLITECRRRDIFSVAYAFTPEEARVMAEAGADVIGAHVGLTQGGLIGAPSSLTLDEALLATQEMVTAARGARPDVLVVAHGGPFEDPESVRHAYARTEVDGYLGASSIERLPIERAIRSVVDDFRRLRLSSTRSWSSL